MKVPAFACILPALTGLLLSTNCLGAPGDLYVADSTRDLIYKFTPAGDRSTFASDFYQPRALAFDRKGNLFVGESGAGPVQGLSGISKVTPDGTKTPFASLGTTDLLGMAFDGAGNLFVSTGTDIMKFAPDGTPSLFAANVPGVWALAFDKSGTLYATVSPIGPASILKFAPDGTHTTLVSFPAGSSAVALAFDAKGHLFVVLGGSILEVEPNGTYTTFASSEFRPALAFDNEGNLFAGLYAFSSSVPGLVKIASNGTTTTFALGEMLAAAFAFEPLTEKLRNISARGLVGTGDDALISGFIIGGNALADKAVIVRAIGPSLAAAHVPHPLQDPVLELHNATGALIASNDNWQDTQADKIAASGLAPSNASESAIYATLPGGNYTAVVRGAGDTTGTALVEVYGVTQ
jgi:hypothetical protein